MSLSQLVEGWFNGTTAPKLISLLVPSWSKHRPLLLIGAEPSDVVVTGEIASAERSVILESSEWASKKTRPEDGEEKQTKDASYHDSHDRAIAKTISSGGAWLKQVWRMVDFRWSGYGLRRLVDELKAY